MHPDHDVLTEIEAEIDGLSVATAEPETIEFVPKPLDQIKGMDEYMRSYGKILGKKAIDALQPLHVPGVDPLPDFDDMLRDPFPVQKHAITAAVKMLDTNGAGFLVGEMGTGKTLMGMSAIHKHAQRSRKKGGHGGKYRCIVLCPDHLIKKWRREILETVPGATVIIFGDTGQPAEVQAGAKMKRKKKDEKGADEVAGSRKTLRDTLDLSKLGREFPRVVDGSVADGKPQEFTVDTESGPVIITAEPTKMSGLVRQIRKRWRKPECGEFYVLGRNQAKWLSDWDGIGDPRNGYAGRTVVRPASARQVIVEKVPKVDLNGDPVCDRRTGVQEMENIIERMYVCPKCGQIARNEKGKPLGLKDLQACKPDKDSKGGRGKGRVPGAKQRKCQARYAVQVIDPDKPQNGRDVLYDLPSKQGGALAGDEFNYNGKKWRIVECKEPLYNYVARPYRWAPALLMQKKLKGLFDYLLIDEVHEHKSDESAQSMACGKLIASCKNVLALTGTIIGGYADHLYALMMRITPDTLRAEDFEWGADLKFSEVYGRIDKIITTKESDPGIEITASTSSMRRAKSGNSTIRKAVRPGVMPTMFGRHLIGSSIFITLDEMAEELPDLFEYIGGECPPAPNPDDFRDPAKTPDANYAEYEGALYRWERLKDGWFNTACTMLPDQAAEYKRVAAKLEAECKTLLQKGSMKLLGAYLWTTTDYPDRPFGWDYDPEVMQSIFDAEDESGAPALLGQSFLGRFKNEFDAAARTLTLHQADTGATDCIPLKKEGNIFWLDVAINGKPIRMAYDTGASTISLPTGAACRLGLKPTKDDSDVIVQVADGSSVKARRTAIETVRVGKFTCSNVEATIVPPGPDTDTVGYWDKKGSKKITNWVGVVTPKSMPEDVIYPKEQKLIDICKKQKADGRQTWVYVQMTGKRNIQPRLKKLLEAEGLKVGVLRSGDVDPKEREDWIAAHGREFDVMLSHPQLVSTGLDLFDKRPGMHNYSTIVFYETGYNLFTMRQAARRAWRIGQQLDCRVYYLYYRETMQHRAMSLMSKKMAAAQALEGEFSEEGLAAMAGEDNMQMALAKSIAERIDSADMQRSWEKIKSKSKIVKRPTDALAESVETLPTNPIELLPTPVALVATSLAESTAKTEPPAGGYRPSKEEVVDYLLSDGSTRVGVFDYWREDGLAVIQTRVARIGGHEIPCVNWIEPDKIIGPHETKEEPMPVMTLVETDGTRVEYGEPEPDPEMEAAAEMLAAAMLADAGQTVAEPEPIEDFDSILTEDVLMKMFASLGDSATLDEGLF